MSSAPHVAAFGTTPSERQARVHRAAQALHAMGIALGANCALLDHPPWQSSTGATDTGGTWSFSFVRSPGGRYVRCEARLSPAATGASVALSMTVRDAAGHSVGPTDPRIPYDWRGEVLASPTLPFAGALASASTSIVGWIDAESLASTLTDPSWSIDVTVSVAGGGALDGITLWEAPRSLVDDEALHGGVVPGSFQRDTIIHAGAVDGLVRLVSTLESARLAQRSYLSLAWRQSTAPTDTPSTTSTSYAPLTLLDAGPDAAAFAVPTRVIHAASTAGEAVQWRVLYRLSEGLGSETARVRLTTLASGSPSTSGALAYTTSWTWSAWKDATVRTSPATDALALTALVSASGPTLWIAGIHVREAVAPLT